MTEHKDSTSKVNHPSYYNQMDMEVIDAIEGLGLDFNEGGVLKYMCRRKHKGTEMRDLEKAKWHLDRLIENAMKGAVTSATLSS